MTDEGKPDDIKKDLEALEAATDESRVKRMAMFQTSAHLGALQSWENWVKVIPAIPMEPGWSMKPVPPIAGALARFCIFDEKKRMVSVFIDGHGLLGDEELPYWEVYPVRGDAKRCALEDVEKLTTLIKEGLEHPRAESQS